MTCVRMPEVGEIWRRRDREFRITHKLADHGPNHPLWVAEQVQPYVQMMPDGGRIMTPYATVSIYADSVRNGRWAFVRSE